MTYNIELQFAARTDTGLQRPHNEDSIAISPPYGLAILADGMGGYNAGEVASSMATAVIEESLEAQLRNADREAEPEVDDGQYLQIVEASVERANNAIWEAAHIRPECRGMGTTVVVALFHNEKVTVAHVGDSRLYRLRAGDFKQITRDHSLLQQQIDAGWIDSDQARYSPNRNLITRAVGVDEELDVEVHEYQTEPGDIYLMCSDGLSDMLSTQEIAGILNRLDSDLDAAADALINMANDNGGSDNISVILVKV